MDRVGDKPSDQTERNRYSWESQPKVTSETITDDSRKESGQLDPIPQRAISC
jgi:hypothetical protein